EFSNGRNKCYIKVKHKDLSTVFLDIFPYDLYHSKTNNAEKKKLHAKIQKIAKRLKMTLFKESNVSKFKSRLKKITAEKIQEKKQCLEENQPSLFWGIDFPHTWKNRVYDWENIFPLKAVEFEGTMFPAPANADFVLTNIYGEYMKPPTNKYPRHTYVNGFNEEQSKILDNIIEEGAR
ncbi:MAG: LicD family protein, partial [Muribaculaceae bacterium]|nr:LicD family protein [Muribaculaceae bacterium]